MNFKRRSSCRMCGSDKQGAQVQILEQQGGESKEGSLLPGEGFRKRAAERGETVRRPPKETSVCLQDSRQKDGGGRGWGPVDRHWGRVSPRMSGLETSVCLPRLKTEGQRQQGLGTS